MLEILVWYILILVIGLLAWPLVKLFTGNKLRDGGYGFSKITGILLLSLTTFQLSFLHWVPFTRAGVIGVGIVLTALMIYICRKKSLFKDVQWRWVIVEELIFLGTFLLFLGVKALNPDIVSTEKFMNYGIIQSLLRMEYGPPADMWYAPLAEGSAYHGLNYYYFGHYIGALLIKISDVRSYYGFNYFTSTIAALSMVEVFSLTINALSYWSQELKKIVSAKVLVVYGLLAAYFVNLAGNLQTLYAFSNAKGSDSPSPIWEVWTGALNADNYQFAAATRVFKFAINEIPSYSYLIGDAHGHVLALPITLALLAVLGMLFTFLRKQRAVTALQWVDDMGKNLFNFSTACCVLIGVLIGAAYMTNAADLITYGGFTALLIVLFVPGLWLKWLSACITFISYSLTTYMFNINYSSIVKSIGVNCAPQWLVDRGSWGPLLFEADKCYRSEWYLVPIAWGVGLLGVLIVTLFALFQKKILRSTGFQWITLLSVIGSGLLIFPELFYFKDIYAEYFRANTMFKLGFQAHVLLSLVFVAGVFLVIHYQLGVKNRLAQFYTYIIRPGTALVVTLLLGVTLLYIPLGAKQYRKLNNEQGAISLNGEVWMNSILPGEKRLVDWMNQNISGQPTILEAFGESYTLYGRVSSFTGLPTIANWRGHEWVWRANANVLDQRILDAQTIYTTADPEVLQKYLNKYAIRYVVYSNLERIAYSQITTVGIDQLADKVYQDNTHDIVLYKIR